MTASRDNALNVLGGALAPCGNEPRTGFYRNGCCDTGPDDMGIHTVCAVMTDAFLVFSRLAGKALDRRYLAWQTKGSRVEAYRVEACRGPRR